MDTSRRAVIIGVNNYEDSRVPELKGAENDAKELCERLKSSGGFTVDHPLLGPQANCKAIRRAISDLLWKTDPCGLSLFYFSGHALQDSRENAYLAPCDMLADAPYVCGIRMAELREMVLASQNKGSVVVVLDCCYSGSITEGKGAPALAPAVDPQPNEWFAPFEHGSLGKGKILLASSGKDEKSHEICCSHEMGGGTPHHHGLFTYYMLEGLDGKAGTKEEVSIDDLRIYIDGQLRDDPHHQLSFFGGGMSQAGQIVIARASHRFEINRKLDEAEDYLAKGVPAQVFRAIKILGEISQKCPTLQRVKDLCDKTNEKLRVYRTRAISWIVKHADPLADYEDWCIFFQRSPLTVEFITQQDALKRGLLRSLCQVAMGGMEEQLFLDQLSATRQEAPALQGAALAGAPGTGAKAVVG